MTWTGSAYDAAGKRNSSKTHARRAHGCDFCDQTSRGNGGKVAHARKHVRSGEAVELVKWYSMQTNPSRVFLAVGEVERIARFQREGYTLRSGDPFPSGPASQLERGINAPSRDHENGSK